VVAAVDVAVAGRQQVPDLAVGVVDDGVEHRHPPDRRVVRPRQRHQVDVRVGLHPQLHHAGPVGAVAVHGGRHDVPAHRLRHRVRGDLAPGQGAVREVPQRALARHRLVHAGGGEVLPLDRAVQRGVGRLDEPPLHGEAALGEQPFGEIGVAGGDGAAGTVVGGAAIPGGLRHASIVPGAAPMIQHGRR